MNATPQCYDYEIGSPGWSFFYHSEALPDDRLGIAQLSNRLLIPPDALPFLGNPNGEFLGYAYMALPFYWCALAFVCIYVALLLTRLRLEQSRVALEAAYAEIEER
jgi:hypothetical protein